jgi:hypothetical protein
VRKLNATDKWIKKTDEQTLGNLQIALNTTLVFTTHVKRSVDMTIAAAGVARGVVVNASTAISNTLDAAGAEVTRWNGMWAAGVNASVMFNLQVFTTSFGTLQAAVRRFQTAQGSSLIQQALPAGASSVTRALYTSAMNEYNAAFTSLRTALADFVPVAQRLWNTGNEVRVNATVAANVTGAYMADFLRRMASLNAALTGAMNETIHGPVGVVPMASYLTRTVAPRVKAFTKEVDTIVKPYVVPVQDLLEEVLVVTADILEEATWLLDFNARIGALANASKAFLKETVDEAGDDLSKMVSRATNATYKLANNQFRKAQKAIDRGINRLSVSIQNLIKRSRRYVDRKVTKKANGYLAKLNKFTSWLYNQTKVVDQVSTQRGWRPGGGVLGCDRCACAGGGCRPIGTAVDRHSSTQRAVHAGQRRHADSPLTRSARQPPPPSPRPQVYGIGMLVYDFADTIKDQQPVGAAVYQVAKTTVDVTDQVRGSARGGGRG